MRSLRKIGGKSELTKPGIKSSEQPENPSVDRKREDRNDPGTKREQV